MFAEAGIDQFPTTWDDFFAACEALQAAGFTPLSLHTTETGWITNLLLTTYLGRTQEGRDFMDIRYPTDEFTSEIFAPRAAVRRDHGGGVRRQARGIGKGVPGIVVACRTACPFAV